MRLNLASKFRGLVFASTLLSVSLLAGVAHAGELKFGEGPSSLQTDDSGKLTAAGAKSAIKELDKLPDEDAWDLRLWARLDRGAAGPLYVEFYQTVNGQQSIVHRHEISYDGMKYVSESIMLEGAQGFNKNRTYKVIVIQNDGKKDITLAESKIKLIKTDRAAAEAAAGGGDGDKDGKGGGDKGDGGGDAESDCSEQDRLDGFCSDDGDKGGGEADPNEPAPDAKPPETTDPASKKGCSVSGDGSGSQAAFLLLLVAGAGFVRRRVA